MCRGVFLTAAKQKDRFDHYIRVKRDWPALKKRDLSSLGSSYISLQLSPGISYRRVFVLLFTVHDVREKTDARGKVHGIDYRSQ